MMEAMGCTDRGKRMNFIIINHNSDHEPFFIELGVIASSTFTLNKRNFLLRK